LEKNQKSSCYLFTGSIFVWLYNDLTKRTKGDGENMLQHMGPQDDGVGSWESEKVLAFRQTACAPGDLKQMAMLNDEISAGSTEFVPTSTPFVN
jgi:hypothetical protein